MITNGYKDILLFSDEYPPDGGGAGIVAKQLSNGLRSLGRSVDLLVGASKQRNITEQYIFDCHRFTLIWPLLYAWQLIRLRAWRYKYFVINDNVAAYLAGLLFSRAMLYRSVILVHGDDGRYFFSKKSLRHRIFDYAGRYKRALKHCRNVVAASNYAKDHFLEYASNYVDPNKVKYSYMGIDTDVFQKKPSTRAEIDVSGDVLLLFSASRLIREKGLLDMLELFVEARRSIKNLHWHIAGAGPLSNELNERISQLGLQECVRLLGQLPREELVKYYSQADIFWLLSKRTDETFGLVYIEAAYFGCPTIACRIAGVPEAINEGVSGYFYDIGSDFAGLIQATTRLDRKLCQKHALKFRSIDFAKYLNSLLSDANLNTGQYSL